MKYDEFLEKNIESWEKVKNTLKKKIVCELVYNEKYLKTRKKKSIQWKNQHKFPQ